mgnify:CR=1 FL=1
MSSYIDIFFAFLNLGVVLVVLSYLVTTKVVPAIQEKIRKSYDDFMHLHNEHRRLLHEQEELELSIVNQEELAKNLFKKMNQWRNMVEVGAQSRKHEREILKEAADKKMIDQAYRYKLYTAYEEVAPQVIEDLEKKMYVRFSDENKQHEYITSLLNHVTKQKS